MDKEEYLETIVVNGTMINVGIDDYGQTYFLEYLNEEGNLVYDCVGAYESDYKGYAEMLFEDPKHCEYYKECEDDCDELDKPYCSRCEKSFMYKDSCKRFEEFKKLYDIVYEC